eukprot:11183003-Lingulodinium_polyedra.AAC.1
MALPWAMGLPRRLLDASGALGRYVRTACALRRHHLGASPSPVAGLFPCPPPFPWKLECVAPRSGGRRLRWRLRVAA